MSESGIRIEREGHLTIVTIDRPDAMNALHRVQHDRLAEIFDEFDADAGQWVAILTGAGSRAFSAGNDLKAMAAGRDIRWPASGFGSLTARFDLDKPLIAAVNGVAMGGGFEMALACDLVIASEDAVFSLPEPRVGLAALAGGVLRLPGIVGRTRAMEIVLTSRRISAAEGYAMGFVNRVVPPAELMDAAREMAAEIMKASPLSIRASKQAMLRGLDCASMAEAHAGQRALPAVRALFASDDFREGPRAFAEKRAPVWSGS